MRSAIAIISAAIILAMIAAPGQAQLGWFTEVIDPNVTDADDYDAAATAITPGIWGIPWMSYVDGPYDGERFHLKTVHLSDSDEWIISTVDTSTWGHASMVIQDEWYPHLCYRRGYDYGQAVLMHAYKNLSFNWVIDTVDAAPGVEDPAIQLNATNDPVIVYGSGASPDPQNLKIAEWNGWEWEIGIVDSSGQCEEISLVFDSQGIPHISYVSTVAGEFQLKYAFWNGERWEIEVLDQITSDYSTSLSLDSEDNPHIAYHYGEEGIWYTYNTTGEWQTEQADAEHCQYASLSVNLNNEPFIAYYQADEGALKFAMKIAGQWFHDIVDDDPDPSILIGRFPAMMTDSWGDICISYYYHESGQPCQLKYAAGYLQGVYINMTPLNPPIIIPAEGGSFEFNLMVGNLGLTTETADIWTNAVLPPGWDFGPFVYIEDLVVPPGWSGSADRIQQVPPRAPAGVYTYRAFAGEYPSTIISSNIFQFEKLAGESAESNFFSGWNNRGEDFDTESGDKSTAIPEDYLVLSVFPNPFNNRSVVSFSLERAGEVSLKVYDVTGREVGSLVSGHLSLGYHEVVWNAEGMASGVYFVRMEAGGLVQARKILLIK